MPAFTHHDRYLSFTSPLGADKLLVESFHGTEAISQLFEFDVELLTPLTATIHPADLIGKRVTLEVQTSASGGKRTFNGMVASLKAMGADFDFKNYRLRMVPMLWLLSLNVQTRVFQGKTVVDIVKEVLQPYSITPKDRCEGSRITLDYCTQYRETDLQFISRLMEQHGIFYFFTHTASDHTLVLATKSSELPPCDEVSTFAYESGDNKHTGFYGAAITRFNMDTSLVAGQHTHWDYRFTQFAGSASNPANSATKAALGSNAHEKYDYAEASAYLKTESGDGHVQDLQSLLQKVQRDREDQQSVECSGESNAAVLAPGATFTLKGYPMADANLKYLLTRVEHHALQRPSYRSEEKDVTQEVYRNLFVAQPATVTYRSPLRTPKPRVQGVVTGKVVAPSGDESYLDKYGRVCVQFWWDRHRKPNTTDNTLLRVAQQWAGKGWGTYFWPRLGDEVLIDFLDGDPDNPIVVGSLYNGTNMPKYDPAGKYTRSGILTQSSKNGGKANANELRFDDLKGSEQIFINAEKDFDTHVENEEHKQIDKSQHLTVGGDKLVLVSGEHHNEVKKDVVEKIGGDHHLAVTGKQLVAITGDQGLKVDGASALAVSMDRGEDYKMNLNQKVGMNHSLQVGLNSVLKTGMNQAIDAGMEVYLKGGMSVIIEAGLEICLKAAGGFITIGPTGVMISGIMVMINSGGAAVPGTPGQPESPKAPDAPKAPKAPSWPGDDPRA